MAWCSAVRGSALGGCGGGHGRGGGHVPVVRVAAAHTFRARRTHPTPPPSRAAGQALVVLPAASLTKLFIGNVHRRVDAATVHEAISSVEPVRPRGWSGVG